MVSYGIAAVIAVVVGVVAAAIAFFCGISYRRKVAEQKLGSAEEEAKRIINAKIRHPRTGRQPAVLGAGFAIHYTYNKTWPLGCQENYSFSSPSRVLTTGAAGCKIEAAKVLKRTWTTA